MRCNFTEWYNIILNAFMNYNVDLEVQLHSSVTQEASKTEKKSEDGQVQKVSSTYTYKTTADLMQEDKDLLDFIAHTVKANVILK
ncbi:MAG: hypothetical protein IPG78_15215 [Ignavibacteria bacterium]|nr:hypothetical protein [Ignavibacteria bacterium]